MNTIDIEDYFMEKTESSPDDKKLVLIIYDITDNKRRSKFVKLMENYGVRVQKSAFEAIISTKQYNSLIERIPYYITDEDNIRVYRLKLTGHIVSWGSNAPEAEEVIII